jgi:two-component system sensor histidine kinase SenX3
VEVLIAAVVALVAGVAIGLTYARARFAAGGEPKSAPAAPAGRDRLPALLLEALSEGAIVVDRGDDVLLANSAARAMGALSVDRLATEQLRAAAHQALDTGVTTTEVVPLPRGFLGREVSFVSVSAVPLGTAEDGRTLAVALLLSDLTESRRLEAVRRDFVANISHELKTPVGALTLLAEAVQEAADDPDAVQRFAARMQHEGQRLGRLVGELIALSRVQGVDALPELEPVSVQLLLDDAIDRSRLVAEKVGISLSASVTPGLMALGDEKQLAMAVANLVDNAVSYSAGGTRVVLTGRPVAANPEISDSDKSEMRSVQWIDPTGRPSPADDPRGQWIEIAVTDQGIGIAESDLDRIFERFYRVDPARSRATGGTGLGLAIVKHVVTNHGGSVDVWSAEGAGSTFTLHLPGQAPVRRPESDLSTTQSKGNR